MATQTTNYNLKKPSVEDFYNVQDQNDNMDILDAQLKANADDSFAKIPKSSATAADQILVSSGVGAWAVKTLAQIKSWLGLGSAAYAAIANNLTTIAAGSVLDASQGKVLSDLISTKVPSTRKINGKALSSDISLTAADVGAPASPIINAQTNGYINISGLIIQWFLATGGNGNAGGNTVTFPIAFPTNCFNVVATLNSAYLAPLVRSIDKNGFNCVVQGAGNYATASVYFIAIGI